MKKPTLLLIAIFGIFLCTIMSILGFFVIQQWNTNSRMSAIQDCFESSYIVTKDANAEKKEPSFYVYKLCIQDKGLSTSLE